MRTSPPEPLAHGHLDVGDSHLIYWETVGNPKGRPVVLLHGGPGGECSPGMRNLVDPNVHYGVLVDQRGCGRSTPSAHEADYDLARNTTPHLIADLEKLREHLQINTWDVLGLSWGAVLGLLYAQSHPAAVSGLIPALLGDPTRAGVDWISDGVGVIFPEARHQLRTAIPAKHQRPRVIDAVSAWVNDPDPAEQHKAAQAWGHWEDTHISLTSGYQQDSRWADPVAGVRFTRLVAHYWSNDDFLPHDPLTAMAQISHIPGVIINGRQDVSSPLGFAWECAQRWDRGRLDVLEQAGHGNTQVSEPRTLMVAVREALTWVAAQTAG